MKKFALTLISAFMAFGVGHAQNPEGLIAQPTHIIGKRINADGEVTKTIEADFTYYDDGKPRQFTIPDYQLTTYYAFEGDYLSYESTNHDAGYPQLNESISYTYEGDKVKTTMHTWSHGYEYPECWYYSYGEDGRLARKDYLHGIPEIEEPHEHYLYEYENDGKTKIQNYWTSWPNQGMKLLQTAVYQYDDEYNLISRHVEDYSDNGELTGSTLDTYSYTPSGQLEAQITMSPQNGEWVNKNIMHYIYDDTDRVVEQLYGEWSAENGEWDINRKVTFELSDDGVTYTVAFYSKNDDEWGRGVFGGQTIFFGSALANQQRTMRFYRNEEYNGLGLINEFEITLVYTEEPNYLDVSSDKVSAICVYPNPGKGNLKVEAHTEDAVIRLYNQQGQLMTARPFDFSAEISTEGWPSGMYLWEVWHENQKEASGKWVKE